MTTKKFNCGCIYRLDGTSPWVEFCPTHADAPDLATAIERIKAPCTLHDPPPVKGCPGCEIRADFRKTLREIQEGGGKRYPIRALIEKLAGWVRTKT